jgi:hypothetical protein
MMALFENTSHPQLAEKAVNVTQFDIPAITQIEDNAVLFMQLQRAKDIPSQFLPEGKEYCLVVTDQPSHTGELSVAAMDKVHAFARMHIVDPKHARWLLVHMRPENAMKPQSTLVCFIQHFSPNALVDNTEGAGVANQIVIALQGLQEEGLVTTNINFELIRKMSSKFGVLFGGSFADLANSLRVHSVDQSVRKSEKVAHEKGLFLPTHAPGLNQSLGGAGNSAGGTNILEDGNS